MGSEQLKPEIHSSLWKIEPKMGSSPSHFLLGLLCLLLRIRDYGQWCGEGGISEGCRLVPLISGTFECACTSGCLSTVSKLPFSSREQCQAHLTGIFFAKKLSHRFAKTHLLQNSDQRLMPAGPLLAKTMVGAYRESLGAIVATALAPAFTVKPVKLSVPRS